eukprot:11152946-Heterocapsa_arctica.AAC.1
MSKNIADGDSVFLHWPKCIGEPSLAAKQEGSRGCGSRQTSPSNVAGKDPIPDELLDAFTAAAQLADKLKANEIPSLHDTMAGNSPPDPSE